MVSPYASGGTIALAVSWVEGALLGATATAVATIAVASIGYLAFTGRMDFRRAAQVLFGCFVLFGAPTIAAGLQGIASAFYGEPASATSSNLPGTKVSLAVPEPAPASRPAYDPYAGAAIAPN